MAIEGSNYNCCHTLFHACVSSFKYIPCVTMLYYSPYKRENSMAQRVIWEWRNLLKTWLKHYMKSMIPNINFWGCINITEN